MRACDASGEAQLWILYAIFLDFDNGRCCGSVPLPLQVEISDDQFLVSCMVVAFLLFLDY
jgi:hypothetical protein